MTTTRSRRTYRVAILDMYNGLENVGLSSIEEVVSAFNNLTYDIFDVRGKKELPDLDYDIYISSGGPGDPLEWDEEWTPGYYQLIDTLWQYNQNYPGRKPAFFICHSFQMMCHHFSLGEINQRRKRSFGVYPVHLTSGGKRDRLFGQLDDPFWAADSREYQFIHPNKEQFRRLGAKVLALEKYRPHIPLERAIMAVRFSNEWVGAQFHPEANPKGMLRMLENPERRKEMIDLRGTKKFDQLLEVARDPSKLTKTYRTLLPSFLEDCLISPHLMESAL